MLVSLTTQANNANEMNPEGSKIAALASMYWGNQVASEIQHRNRPGITFSVYTDFESDEHDEYTYFIGEVVDSLEDQNFENFETITIPASRYQTFTTEAGKMPNVVINAWQQIWAMDPTDFISKRKYIADFEVYDERSAHLSHAVVDIYIGIDN